MMQAEKARIEKEFAIVEALALKKQQKLEDTFSKLDDLYDSGKLEEIIYSQDAHSILSDMFDNFEVIQDYNDFILELCNENVQDNYGLFLSDQQYEDAINDLIQPMQDMYTVYECYGENLIFRVN